MLTLHGMVLAAITPMKPDQSIDTGAVRALVNCFIDAGVTGLFFLASQGEFYSLERSERRLIVRAAVRAASKRIPIVVNTGAISTRVSVMLSQEAEGEGADAIGPITPFYLRPNHEEMFRYYRAIIHSVRIPVYAYNNPPRAGGVGLDEETVIRLARATNRFAGIFDAEGNFQFARRCARLQGGRFGYFLAGSMEVARALAVGAKGVVIATANAAPADFVAMYEAERIGNHKEAARIRRRLEPLHNLFRHGPFPGTMKACLDLLGLPAGPPRLPALPASREIRSRAAMILKDLENDRVRRGRGGPRLQ